VASLAGVGSAAVPKVPSVLLAAEGLMPKASGIGRVARLVAKVLAEEQHKGRLHVRALALNDDVRAADLGIRVQVCGGSRRRFVLACAAAAIDCSHYIHDAVSVARAQPHWLWPRRPALIWVHGIEVWEAARAAHLRAIDRATALVTNSVYTRERARRLHGGFDRAEVCWLATEGDAVSKRTPLPGAEHNVLLLGRIDPAGGEKGHRELIEAWPSVLARVPKARLIIAGGGPAEGLVRDLITRSAARDNIDLLGFVLETQLEQLWDRASVFAMPARGEGFGLTYVEAMRHGLPVIGSVHDAAVEINEHGVTGLNVDLNRAGALAGALVELLTQPKLMAAMGEAGRERWQRYFCYSRFRARFLPILERYLGLSQS
jgi:phosphatidylinositol alpha-1,6-mannosyltransferase